MKDVFNSFGYGLAAFIVVGIPAYCISRYVFGSEEVDAFLHADFAVIGVSVVILVGRLIYLRNRNR